MALDIERVLGREYLEYFYEGYRIKDHVDQKKMNQFIQLVEA